MVFLKYFIFKVVKTVSISIIKLKKDGQGEAPTVYENRSQKKFFLLQNLSTDEKVLQ